jgi:hypothetical protein
MNTALRIIFGLSRATAVLALATSVGGCVAAKHYDEARSVAETEMAGHGRTRARLATALARLDDLEKAVRDKELLLSEKEQELDAGESIVAASKLEMTVARTEKRAAGELVDQLRAELARTGDHLRIFSHDKHDLERALLVAEERLRSVDAASKGLVELVGTARDLAVELGDLIVDGNAALGVKDGSLALTVQSERLFAATESVLGADGPVVVTAVARAALQHPGYRVIVRQPPASTVGAARTESLLLALRERGVPNDRIALASERPEQAGPEPDALAPGATDAKPEPTADGRGHGPALGAEVVASESEPVPESYEIRFTP